MVVELSVGSAELDFEGECKIVVGLLGLAPTDSTLVTCARSSSILAGEQLIKGVREAAGMHWTIGW